MFYKCTDTRTSTRDWFSLAVDAIPQSLLVGENGERFEDLNEIPPDPPELDTSALHFDPPTEDRELTDGAMTYYADRADYPPGPEGDAQHAADVAIVEAHNERAREFADERESEDRLPMWSTMWCVEDHPDVREAARAVGLRLYEHALVDGLLLGADSAGHSFYGAYWIPLRARLGLSVLGSEPSGRTRDRRRRFLAMLREEAKREGDLRTLEHEIKDASAAESA